MRKKTALWGMVIAAAMGLWACGKEEEAPQAGPEESKETSVQDTSGAEASGEGEIDYSGEIRIFSSTPDLADYWQAIKEEYETLHPDVTLNFEVYDSTQYHTALSTAFQSGDMPDLFTSYGSKNAALKQYVDAGAVVDLTPYYTEEELAVFDTYLIQRAKIDEKLYMSPGSFIDAWPIFYNKKIFADNNLEVPKNYEEFLQIMDTLTEKGITAMSFPGKDVKVPATILMNIQYCLHPEWVEQMIGFDFDSDPSGKLSDSRHGDACQELLRWIEKGYFGKNWKGLDTNGGILEFTSGEAAMWWRGSYDKNAITANSDIEVGAFWPVTTDGKKVMISGQNTATGFSISSKTPNFDLALDVMKFITGKESMAKIASDGTYYSGRSDVVMGEGIFGELQKDVCDISYPLYCDYFGALSREGADSWVEYKAVCTALAFGEKNAEEVADYMEQNVIDYSIRNFDPWGDGR
ncbi:MAG: extracellular solute-binding protein [Lachnospiraceae bacterium]|nr:extracellular solute-binding protein [Lachnospiraceae bacterium]